MPLAELVREPPADAAERVLLAVDCAKEDRIGDEAVLVARPARPRRRPSPRQHALRRRQPHRRRRVVDRRGAARRLRRAGRRADAGARGAALHRARHRHRAVPVREHDAEGAPARSRARRGRRRHPRRLPAGLRVRRVREAQAARPRSRPRRGARGRADRRLAPPAHRLRARSARPSRTPRGSSTICARSKAPSSRC